MLKNYKSAFKFLIPIAIVLVLIFIFYNISYMNGSKTTEKEELKSTLIKTAITNYIMESGDEELTFGGKGTIDSVDLLIKKLQDKIVFNGNEFNAYLTNLNYPNEPKSDYYKPYKKTKIIIYKNQNDYELKVYVGSTEDKDTIKIME